MGQFLVGTQLTVNGTILSHLWAEKGDKECLA